MLVEKIQTIKGERYVLLDKQGDFVIPVVKFLKYRDNIGAARNTLRRIAYNLKLFFDFLEQKQLKFIEINVDSMAEFVAWLKKPIGYRHVKVNTIRSASEGKTRSAVTINYVIDDVIRFYEYLNRHDEFSNKLNDQLKREVRFNSTFKRFLHHIGDKKIKVKVANSLKQAVPTKRIKILSKTEIDTLLAACTNIRDKFLLFLLWESGIRISEALSLQLSDIEHARGKIHIRDRGVLTNKAEIKTVGSERTVDCSQELTNLYSTYLLEVHDSENVDTNFVFIKLSGKNSYEPMDYGTVVGLFKNLKRKTKINVHPHMYRHTSLTELARKGMRMEALQKRAGHKHIQTTIDIYTHFEDEDVRNEWERATNYKGDMPSP